MVNERDKQTMNINFLNELRAVQENLDVDKWNDGPPLKPIMHEVKYYY